METYFVGIDMTMDQQTLAAILQGSMSPNPTEIKASETQLAQAEKSSAGVLLNSLLMIVFGESHTLPIKQSAAIFSKNLLKRRWAPQEDGTITGIHGLSDSEKSHVRQLLLDATCGPKAVPLPRQINAQVNAIISFIADIDFPNQWPSLLPSLVNTLNSSPSDELRLNALNVVCSVFRKYKTVSRSNEILMELKYLLPLFQAVHLQLFTALLPGVLGSPSKEVMLAMEQILEIFYSLNVVDIPEFYQDHINDWMNGFIQILGIPSTPSKDDTPGPIENLKSHVCENLALYADKYQEPFEPFVQTCVRTVWGLLVGLDCNEQRFDHLVATGIKFLSSSANTKWANSPFDETEALVQICEKLVLPNIQLRDVDVELFTDNPDDYIRKDLQSADSDTRRRSAVDLVKSLSKFYEDQTTQILISYIKNLLENFSGNIRARDACIQLVTAIAAKGETRALGVSVVNAKVDINQFFSTQVMPIFREGVVGGNEEKSVLQASSLKFLILFRNQLNQNFVLESLPLVLNLVSPQSSKVVQSYAAHCGYLLLGLQAVSSSQLPTMIPHIENILRIFVSVKEQNEYLAKLMFKLLSLMPPSSQSSLAILEKLTALVVSFSLNPMNAVFTHYLFESVGIVTAAVATDPKAREILVQPMCVLLDKNIMEYILYALQVLALLIEAPNALSHDVFKHLFTLLMNEELWKNFSLIPGMVRITQAYLFCAKADATGAAFVIAGIPTIASRATMLLGTMKFEAIGFDLVNSIFTLSESVSDDVVHQVLLAVLTKLHHKRTVKLVANFATSLSVLVSAGTTEDAVNRLVRVCDRIQPGLSVQVIRDLWMQGVSGMNFNTLSVKQKKVVMIALGKLVGAVGGNQDLANAVLVAAQNMICVNPGKEIVGAGAVVATATAEGVETDDSGSFEVSYSKLSSTTNAKTENDYIHHVHADPVHVLKHAVRSCPAAGAVATQLLHWANTP